MTTLAQYLQIGRRTEIGKQLFTREDVIRFASQYDPQPFHLNEDAAKASLFGGLCASGWHTCAAWMKANRDFTEAIVRQYNKENNTDIRVGPSPGFEDLHWLKPVFADQTITFFNTPKQMRESQSKPGWWLQTLEHEGANDKGELVMTFTSTVFIFGLSQMKQLET